MSDRKSGVLDFLKSAFVETVPEPNHNAIAVPAHPRGLVTAPVRNSSVPTFVQPSAAPVATAVAPDPASLAKLEDQLQKSLPPVYAAFMDQYAKLDIIPDESLRFQAALRASSASIPQLATALEQLLDTMATTHSSFVKSFETRNSTAIGAAQQLIASTQATLQAKEAALSAAMAEIEGLKAKCEADTQHMQAEEAHRLEVRQGFEAAYAQVVSRLNAQMTHIAAMPKG